MNIDKVAILIKKAAEGHFLDEELELNPEIKEAIAHGNAEKLFKLPVTGRETL